MTQTSAKVCTELCHLYQQSINIIILANNNTSRGSSNLIANTASSGDSIFKKKYSCRGDLNQHKVNKQMASNCLVPVDLLETQVSKSATPLTPYCHNVGGHAQDGTTHLTSGYIAYLIVHTEAYRIILGSLYAGKHVQD